MKKNRIRLTIVNFIFLLCLFIFSSCVSANLDYTAVDAEINAGNYTEALNTVNERSGYYYTSADKVLSYLDAGVLEHFAGEYENSNSSLHKAEVEIEKNFSKSISQSIGQMLINDSVADYAGETYEDIYTNIFKCLNYIHLNQIDEAMVEIRRFDNKMKVVGHEYQAVIDSQKQNASADEYNEIANLDTEVKFHNSAFARYLSMLLYRTSGDYYSAKIDLEKINDAFRFQKEVYNFSMPSGLQDELVMPEDMARVNAICFTGKSPVKIEEVLRLPLGSTYYKLALPVMERRPSTIYGIQVVLKNKITGNVYKINMHAIESIENIAEETYKQHYATIYARTLARSIAKAVKTGIYDTIADKSDDSRISGIFTILDFVSRINTEVTETADTRISRYFPGYASVGGVSVPEGYYDVEVNFYDSGKRKVYCYTISDYHAEIGKLNLVEATYQH